MRRTTLLQNATVRDEHFDLTPAQEKAALAIVEGKSISEAATSAEVSRSTIHRWLMCREFAEYIALQRAELRCAYRLRLERLADRAVSVVGSAIDAGDVRVAIIVLKSLGLLAPATFDPKNILTVVDSEVRGALYTAGIGVFTSDDL